MKIDFAAIGDDDRMPWRQWRWAFGAVWLVFLGFPVSATLDADLSASVKAAGFALIGVFGLVYLAATILFMSDFPARGRPSRGAVTVFVVLAALAVALFPIIGMSAFGLVPFLMALSAFVAPRRAGIALILAFMVAAFAVPELAGWDVDYGLIAIMVAVGMTMIAMRAVRERENARDEAAERQRRLNAELAVVAERERVARDVHDILGHSLTVISVKTELAGRLVDLDPDRAKAEIAEVNALSREALAEVRSTVGRLRTPDLPSSLAAAATALRAAGVRARLPERDVRTPHAALFAWVIRESVTNVVRHAGATRCEVEVTAEGMSVADDGHGSALLAYGNGLRGLSERVADAGGTLTVESDAEGTRVVVDMRDHPGASTAGPAAPGERIDR